MTTPEEIVEMLENFMSGSVELDNERKEITIKFNKEELEELIFNYFAEKSGCNVFEHISYLSIFPSDAWRDFEGCITLDLSSNPNIK